MPNRFQKPQHELAGAFIDARDGHYCLSCFIDRGIKNTLRLQIDHADSNVRNWDPENLHWLCPHCNNAMRVWDSEEHRELILAYSAENALARARENKSQPTTMVKHMVDYSTGSIEMQANSVMEVIWLDFMHGWIRANGSIPKKEAINGGAAASGANPSTTARYLDKYTSVWAQCFVEIRDSLGGKMIVYRETSGRV